GAWPRAAMEASELWVGFVGAGRMAGGLVRGLLQAGKVPASNILASAPSDKNLEAWRVSGATGVGDVGVSLTVGSLPVLLTSPPAQWVTPCLGVSGHPWVLPRAGTPFFLPSPSFPQLLPPWTKVLRIMPNLPCVVQAGAMVFSRGSNAGDGEAALLKGLLSSCGLCEEVPESYIDIHTGLSGSGVAYGAAKMLLETGEHPAKLRGDVCTPGGTTIYALHQLEKGALRATVMDAVEAATNRACDMAKD
ncbi:P5CR3 reductase, partial [Leiothrix lutea]|nr:P5CR3 reductase [Leiothrix lutea]